MLIELPSKEVKELFEGDFTQTSGSQRKDNHHPHPPSTPHFPRASLHDCSALRARTHERGRSTAAPRSSGQPRPVPRTPAPPVLRTARPGSTPAATAGSGRQQRGPLPPSLRGGGPLCLPSLSILRFPPPLPEGRPPRPRRAAGASCRAARCPPLPLWELRPAPAVLTARPGLRLKVRRLRAQSGSACKRRDETLPVTYAVPT